MSAAANSSAKFSDHLPLYRQERIFGRAGLAIPRSTLAQWVVVDVMEELVKFTLLVRGRESYLVDRYSERKESAASQLVAGVVSTGGGQGCRAG